MGFNYAAKIQSLIAKADSAAQLGNDAEAAAYHTKAQQLMREYRVSEENLLATDPTAVTPIQHVIVLGRTGDLAEHLYRAFRLVANHTGVRYRYNYSSSVPAITVVGYEGDVRYTEFLWTAAYLMFSTRIDPTWDPSRSEDENIFLMRSAGLERRRIADAAWGTGDVAAARSKVQRVYVREATRRGEPVRAAGLGFDTNTYRLAYAESFVTTLGRRLQEARDASDSVGGALVLPGRSDRVDEAFYGLFPEARPTPSSSADTSTWVDPRTTCTRKACREGRACREHSYLKARAWTKADQDRWERRTSSASALAGTASGRDAAGGVVIQRGTERTGRLDSSGHAIEN